jgi:hypothetical protein
MPKVEKSFSTLGLADGILDGVVACLIESEKKAKSSKIIQTIDVSRRGLRQDIYVGKLMVIPHNVMDNIDEIPHPLLKGAVLKLFNGEDASALEMHRLSSGEFDQLTPKNILEYKDKVFRDDNNKMGCIIVFQPAWANFRDYHAFRFNKDVAKLTTLVRHLVFSAYYDPRFSALFDTLSEDQVKLDALNIEHDHLGPAYELQSEEKSHPLLEKFEKKGGLLKRAADEKDAAFMKLSPDEFVQAYLEAALWASTEGDDEGTPLDRRFTMDDFSSAALRKADEDCQAFIQLAGDKLSDMSDEKAGHLFWLDRCGHGTGFWDEDSIDSALGQELSELCKQFGECDVYVDDDGQLQITGGQIPAPTPEAGSGHILPKESKWIRFANYNLTKIAEETMTPEEQQMLGELETQLVEKLSSENFPDGVTAGDAGSVRIPTSPNTGQRGGDDENALAPEIEKVGGETGLRRQPDYGEADSYTSEANAENSSPSKSRSMLAALLTTASVDDGEVINGYIGMREALKSTFAGDMRSPETDHKEKKLAAKVDAYHTDKSPDETPDPTDELKGPGGPLGKAASRLIRQHKGESFTPAALLHVASNFSDDPKGLFQHLRHIGALESFSNDTIKVNAGNNDGDGEGYEFEQEKASEPTSPEATSRQVTAHAKMALTYMHPGQALEQFYPEVLKDISNYPSGYQERNYTAPPLQMQEGNIGEPSQVTLEDYSDGGMKHPMAEPGLIPSQDSQSVPLKPNERNIRGPFFSDQFYRTHADIPPALMVMKDKAASLSKTAAAEEKTAIVAEFLKKLAGEIASSLLAAYMVTGRPVFTYTPAESFICLTDENTYVPMNPMLTGGGMNPVVAQLKSLFNAINDGELAEAINGAWAQGAVWHDDVDGRYLYEIFVRIEEVDTETLNIKYKFITGTKE